jgi:ribosomal protein S4
MCKLEQNTDQYSRKGKKIRAPQYWIGYTEVLKIKDKKKKLSFFKIKLFLKRPDKNFEKYKYFDDEDNIVNLEVDLEKVRNEDLLLLSYKKLDLRNNKTQLNKLIEMRELELILNNQNTYLAVVRRSVNTM